MSSKYFKVEKNTSSGDMLVSAILFIVDVVIENFFRKDNKKAWEVQASSFGISF